MERDPELRDDVAAVQDAHQRALDSARPDAIAKQHERGKRTARERIDLLLDPDGRIEYGALVTPDETAVANVSASDVRKGTELPFEGPVAMTGFIEGRPVVVRADDFTLLGGSGGKLTGLKMGMTASLSLRRGIPLIDMIDSGGHRIHNMDSRMFATGGGGVGFVEMALISGWTPHVAAVMGPAFAGPAMTAAMADFVPIVQGTGALGLAGPKLVKAAVGEDLSAQELGGADPQTRAGVADLACTSDEDCIERIKDFLSYLPTNASQRPPLRPTDDPPDRLCDELRDLVPSDRKRAYDMKRIVRALADDGVVFEMQPAYGKNMITAFVRLGGMPVGIIANQPMVLAGALDAAACTKAARFVWMCNAYGLPLVTLIDTPGTMVGTKAERENTVRAAGKLLIALGHVSVPLVSIVIRKAYGAGYVGMAGGRSYEAEASWVWPTAEINAMGVEGSVDIAFHREYESAPDPAARRQELIDEFYAQITPLRAASGFGVDDAMDPADTRRQLITVFRSHDGRRVKGYPPKLHAIPPF
jgi:acetyl-CoA carboxylase carboxyltransferase component